MQKLKIFTVFVLTCSIFLISTTGVKAKETAAHEVGHALGLKHTQSKNNKNSLMRQFGFNNKDWALSDDKAGIAKKY
ncbi:matrixin family metalloprotease [Listeria monocytogenes]|nr:matrixin family metalloprotease [Listeria monocytogenes]